MAAISSVSKDQSYHEPVSSANHPLDQKVNKIFESYKIVELLPYVMDSQRTKYVLLDLDNTVIAPLNQEIGSAQWRKYIKEKASQEGYTPDEAEEVLDHLWYYVMPHIRMRLVDEEARRIVQQKSFLVLGFTAREYKETAHTEKQLSSLKVSFANVHFEEEIKLPLPYPALYKNGIIYCGENTKGDALLAFFTATNKTPEEIDVADDKKEQLVNVQNAVKNRVAFIGMHLRTEDERVASFDGAIADLQLEMLPQLVSDQEAREMLASIPRPRLKLREFLKTIGS